MANVSSILAAHLSTGAGQLPTPPQSLDELGTSSAGHLALLAAICMLIVALQCMRRALEPMAVIVRSIAAAAAAVILTAAALGFVLVAIVSR
jgi:hypothetical protein